MADVQLENGYTRVANELLEAIYTADFNATQLNIILVILRYTYGFGRKSHALSLNFIAHAVKGYKRHVQRELQYLIDKRVIFIIKEATFNSARELAVNKNYEAWERSDGQQVSYNTTDVFLDNTTDVFLDTQERKSKKKVKKDVCASDYDIFFDSIWSLYPNKKGKSAVKPSTRKKLHKLGYEKLSLAISRYKQEIETFGTAPQYVKHGSTFFNGAYTDYLSDDWKPPDSAQRSASAVDIFD